MNKLLWSCAALLTLFAAAESLTCYTCDLEILDSCLKKSELKCTGNKTMCYKAVADFTGELLKIHDRGCIEEGACRNRTGSILNINYTVTRHCCSTDLCNGAATVHPPLAAALCAALLAAWFQWGL